ALMAKGDDVLRPEGDTLTVVAADRPGLFSTVTGVLALHGMAVRSARAYSDRGRALARLAVELSPHAEDRWERVCADVQRALAGRLALPARLAGRSRAQLRHRGAIAAAGPSVRFENEASSA